MASFLGMRGNDDWAVDERPKNWRQGLLFIEPNGDAPLTAITSMGRSESTDDPEFSYFDKDLEAQGGVATGVFDDSLLTAASAGAGVDGTTYFVQAAEAIAEHFRPGHTVIVVDQSDIGTQHAFGVVQSVVKAGANSYVSFTHRGAVGILDNLDYIGMAGNANAEGAPIPDAVNYLPVKRFNYTQILRTPLDITRTAAKTRLRTGNSRAELKRESLLYHGIAMELAMIWGHRSEYTGANGKPERTTRGLVEFIAEEAAAANTADYPDDNPAITWLNGGENWFDDQLEVNFRFGSNEKLALCGSGALLGINRIAKNAGQFNFTAETGAYGIKVTRWTTPFGDLLIKKHPLFTTHSYMTNMMLIVEPANIRFRFIDDTHFKSDDSMKKAGQVGIDGVKEEYLTEGGWEFHFPNTFSLLTGVGVNG